MRTKLVKNTAAALLALAMVLSLTACGHQHTWADATCTTPKTCTECGKTEGEVLAHDWQEATCAAPKTCSLCKETEGEALPHTWEDATCAAPRTCSVCGETEGEPLPHTLTEANYQSPATCTVCGATEGEKVPATCEEHPFPLMEQGVTYDCPFAAYKHIELDVPGHVTLTDVWRFDSDETFPAMEGYEYIHAAIDFDFSGDDVWNYGYWNSYLYWDYYRDTAKDADENGVIDRSDDLDENGNADLSINFNGIDWEDCLIHCEFTKAVWDSETKSASQTLTYTIRVPVGYDGMIIGLLHPRFADAVNTSEYLGDVYEEGYFVLYRLT